MTPSDTTGPSKRPSRWRAAASLLHPPIEATDPEHRFRLRALRTMAQISSAGVILPLVLYTMDVASEPTPTYLLVTSALAFGFMVLALALLRSRANAASYYIVPAAFLLPNANIVMGVTVELVYPVLIVMTYAAVLLPRWAMLSLHAAHLAVIATAIASTDVYTLFPKQGSVNSTHYFSTYLILYAIAVVYTNNLYVHFKEVHDELRHRNSELKRANRHLSHDLAARTEELLAHQHELSQVRKMEALGLIAGGIAHDVNNLMASIQVNQDLLETKLAQTDLPEREEIERIMLRIQRAVNRGEALIHRVLAVSHREHFDTEPLSAQELVESVVDLVRPTLPAHIRVVSTPKAELPTVEGDRAQLEQVLMNLLSNSIHAIGDSPGEIRIEVAPSEDGRVMLAVFDTGEGIPEDVLPHVLDPFFTTKPEGTGTGLGLAQVNRIVTEHGGSISVDSTVGTGTMVTLVLPVATMGSDAATEPALPAVSGTAPKILLAEDEDDIAEVIVAGLPAARIRRFRSTKAALQAIERATEPYDLLLLDLSMPDGSGQDIFKAARRRWPDIPVLITTGYTASESLQMLLAHSATEYLRKPFSLRALRAAVARMITIAATDRARSM